MTVMMRQKTEEEKYSVFLFLIEEWGRDIFSTIEWVKKVDAQGDQTEKDDITVKKFFKRFEELTAEAHMVYENAPATKSRLEKIKEETAKDPELKKITDCIIQGWPNSKDNILNEAKSYWSFREELSIIKWDCI